MTLVPPSLPCACWQMRVGEWVRRRSRYIFLTLWATTSPSCGARRVHPERARPRRLASVAAIDRRRRRRTSPRRRQPPPPFESASVGGRVAAAAAARGGAADERAAEAAGEREGGLPFGCSPRARPRRRSDRRRRPSQPSASAARGPVRNHEWVPDAILRVRLDCFPTVTTEPWAALLYCKAIGELLYKSVSCTYLLYAYLLTSSVSCFTVSQIGELLYKSVSCT